jgi:hypothetical protein
MVAELSIARPPDGLQITCPECRATFPLGDALRAEIEDDVLHALEERHRLALDQARRETADQVRAQVSEQLSLDIQKASEDAAEQKAHNRELRENLVDLTRQLRRLESDREADRLKNEAALKESQEKIRTEEKERAYEEHRLKLLEKEKQLQDARDDAARLRARLEQGSQQTQGEVLELDLEAQLRQLFPGDDILPTRTGARGADIRQVVRTPLGEVCGTILWEAKNTQQWQATWPGRLKENMLSAAADHGVLICANTPDSVGAMGHLETRAWAAQPRAAATLAAILRQTLMHTHAVTALNANKGERIEALSRYITGPEFRLRIEALQEFFANLQEDDEKERTWMTRKWARREKQIRMVVDNVLGLVGDFEGINGTAILPALPPADPDSTAAN